ncbi:hypothetical protein DACRYDRAFT_20122 [Dacryopinax primogenitus]|uniref:RlpA-like protein double-psi beta-barrel domain-containing protein n=1 Tax=Dacryopinax primogenitus (strain DJM 731) TaxID=1858805 RepID=M5GA90_DACPD|nr:uncharacterized protein DACRYDRAFT_20122 [Dacryopinax primogenitus]EJU05724.1 hypothetical protein DACRYDRAFT_20122 [Dacryopinax primogenitus]
MISIWQLSSTALLLGLVSAAHLQQTTRADKRHRGFGTRNANLTQRGQTFSGRATWFNVGLGACGETNVPSDMMVALNYLQFGDGYPAPQCFQSITIEYNGQQQVATILDECPQGSCDAVGQLDLSTGLFSLFEDTSLGQFDMTWWFNDDPPSGDNGGSITTSSTDPAPWTSTTTTTTSSTSTSTTTTSTTASSLSTSSTTSTTASSSGSLGGTSGTGTSTDSPTASGSPVTGNMAAAGNLVVAFGEIVMAGSKD